MFIRLVSIFVDNTFHVYPILVFWYVHYFIVRFFYYVAIFH